jgi:hypothetical protein
MRRHGIYGTVLLLGTSLLLYAAQDVGSAVEGTVKSVDTTTKTITVDAADGTEHTFHVVGQTVVHPLRSSDAAATDSYRGVREGSHVVVHYTTKGGEETIREIDRVGESGLKTSTGTIDHLDRAGKILVIKSADGTKSTYHLTDRAASDAGHDIAKGSEKSAKVTVYYTEEAGNKVAHFFKAAV